MEVGVAEASDSFPSQRWDIEIDQQTDRASGEFQRRNDLGLVHGSVRRDSFYFHEHDALDDEVDDRPIHRATQWLRIPPARFIMQPGGCMMTLLDLSRIDRTIEIDAPARTRVAGADRRGRAFGLVSGDDRRNAGRPAREVWMTSVHPLEPRASDSSVRIVEMTPAAAVRLEVAPG